MYSCVGRLCAVAILANGILLELFLGYIWGWFVRDELHLFGYDEITTISKKGCCQDSVHVLDSVHSCVGRLCAVAILADGILL